MQCNPYSISSDLLLCVVVKQILFLWYSTNHYWLVFKHRKWKTKYFLYTSIWTHPLSRSCNTPSCQSDVVNVHSCYSAKIWFCWIIINTISSNTLGLPHYWLYFHIKHLVITKSSDFLGSYFYPSFCSVMWISMESPPYPGHIPTAIFLPLTSWKEATWKGLAVRSAPWGFVLGPNILQPSAWDGSIRSR